jgi:serine/threonine-protein kinase
MDQFQQAIEKGPKDAQAHASLGYALVQLKDTSGAINELKLALELQPDSPGAENNLAWMYATADDLQFRNPAEALVLARRAVESSQESNPAFLDTLAEALLLNGQPAQAFATEAQAAKLDPENSELQSRLARFREAAKLPTSSKP